MSRRLLVACVLASAAASPAVAQDWFEPNPSLAALTADDAYARTSAQSLKAAGIVEAVAIRLDDAGRVVVAGVTDRAPADAPRFVRLDLDGRLDLTFGVAGVAELPVWGSLSNRGLEIDAAGRIVVTGAFYEWGTHDPSQPHRAYWAARLLPDGSLDPAFSGDGLLEADAASGLNGLGAVHAAGGDGAMLVLAQKAGPSSYEPIVGLVRIAADGTIDDTYGDGGFAPITPTWWRWQVADFVVDSAGRAVVAAQDGNGSNSTVLRLDATGGLPPYWWYSGGSGFGATQLAFDGAGRLVGLGSGLFLRRLADGAPDRTFSSDGFAWNQDVHIVGLSLNERAALCAAMHSDPDYSGDDLVCGGGLLLAVATRADRWATARLVETRNATRRFVQGIEVRAIDPADPGAIISTTYRPFDGSSSGLVDLAIAPDGTAAYALGGTSVLRVDLVSRKPLPLPDLRPQWIGNVRAIDLGGGRYRVSALVRVRNVSRHDAESVIGLVGVGDAASDVALAHFPDAPNSLPFRVRARSSVVRRFTWEGGDIKTDLAGARLGIQVSCELPDADFADNTATSQPITPVYAPR